MTDTNDTRATKVVYVDEDIHVELGVLAARLKLTKGEVVRKLMSATNNGEILFPKNTPKPPDYVPDEI